MQFWFLKYLSLVLLCLNASLSAQWRGPQLTSLGPGEGINSWIITMAQDSSQMLYLGSLEGLYTYDSHMFRFFGHDPLDSTTIGQGNVLSIICSRDGMIWLTLRFGGLNRFDPKTSTFTHFPVPKLHYRSDPGAHSLLEDTDGTLWVGGGNFRLFAFDRNTQEFTTYSPDWIDAQEHGGRLTVLSITQDPEDPNLLWLAVLDYYSHGTKFSSYGLVAFDKRTKEFTPYPCVGKTRYVDHRGHLWGTCWGNWITHYDPQTQQCDTFQYKALYRGQIVKPLTHDIELYQEKIYVSSSRSLMTFDPKSGFELVMNTKDDDEYSCLFTDHMNNLWIGSTHGAYVIDPDRQHIRFFSLSEMGYVNRLYPARLAYHASEDVVYLSQNQSSQYSGYFRIPMADNKVATFIKLEHPVFGLASDHHDRIWMLWNGAFQLLNPETEEITRSSIHVSADNPLPNAFMMKSNHTGWIGATDGNEFVWFHADTQQLRRIKLNDLPGSAYAKSFRNGFHGFTFNERNTAYLYSTEVHQLDLVTGNARALKYDTIANLHQQSFRYAGEDKEGNIWLSTFTMVGKFNLHGDSMILQKAYTIRDGMSSPVTEELHFDAQNRIWCFTPLGINCIDPVSSEIRSFSTKEGLPLPLMDPTEVLSLSNGRIATVNDNGLIVYNAEELWKSVEPAEARVVIQKIRINGEQLTPTQMPEAFNKVTLKYENRGMDIGFQALSFPTDDLVEYSYRITGLQEDWISIGQNRLITIPALSPGAYTFEVKVGRPQSLSPITSLGILVSTPLFMQTWFILLSLVALLALIFGIYRWRINTIRRQEVKKTEVARKIAELELKALRSQMNPHFMFNSLNSIKNYILHSEPKLAAEYLSNFAHLIRMILQNSREKSISLQNELETLILYIELEKLRFDNAFSFECIVDKEVNLESVKIPPMLLQPYVENAIWHGLMHKRSRGHLLLQFARDGDQILCIIEDDGVGRTKAEEMKSLSATRYKSMGMGITKDRIEIMNKMDALGISAEVIDKYDTDGASAGTRVVLRIPATHDIYS